MARKWKENFEEYLKGVPDNVDVVVKKYPPGFPLSETIAIRESKVLKDALLALGQD